MTTRKNLLDRVEITSPCTADWDEMAGTDQIRYCAECQKYVYNLSEMTRREAEALVASRRSQMCAKLIRNLDGQTLTADWPAPVRLLGWRPGPIASAVVSAMISITPGAAGLAKGRQVSSQQGYSIAGFGQKSARAVTGSATSAITGLISDENGTAIMGAVVTLTSEASGEVLSQLTSEEGEFRFEGLAPRTYIVEIRAKGYELVKHHDVNLQPGEARRFDVAMENLVQVMGAMGIPSQPLRTLYLESDRVVVAQVGKSTNQEKASHGRSFKTSLIVSQTIKGDGHKPEVDVYHWAYGGERGQLIEGQTVLAFLQRKEDAPGRDTRDSYELIYGASSAKHLSPSDLETYVHRLEELKAIVSNPEPTPSDILEWLVRCAEDPVTRPEGSFELQNAASREEWAKKEADRRAAAGEPLDSTRKKLNDQQPVSVALLTSEQKQRLMNALLKSEEPIYGDWELIELAKRWNDPRLLPFLMSYLHRFEETAPQDLWRVMQPVAELLGDEKLGALSRNYLYGESREDLEVEEEEDGADSSTADPEQAENEPDASGPEEDTAVTLTPEAAREARVTILKKFFDVVEVKIKLAPPK